MFWISGSCQKRLNAEDAKNRRGLLFFSAVFRIVPENNKKSLVFYRLLLWKLKKQEGMPPETRVIEELEKIRVVLLKRGDEEAQFMFETMGLDQMRLITEIGCAIATFDTVVRLKPWS